MQYIYWVETGEEEGASQSEPGDLESMKQRLVQEEASARKNKLPFWGKLVLYM